MDPVWSGESRQDHQDCNPGTSRSCAIRQELHHIVQSELRRIRVLQKQPGNELWQEKEISLITEIAPVLLRMPFIALHDVHDAEATNKYGTCVFHYAI